MENCIYQGKAICTFDLKDESGLYYEDMVLEWKQAAADHKLTCIDCNAHVYLAAGPIKEPYFAHYDLEDCDYGNGHESEEMKKGKRLLYQLLKRSFPNNPIQARYRMENAMFSTLFCSIDTDKSFAIDYRLQNNSLEKYRLRDSYYQANNITPIYVMGIRQMKNIKQIDWYQNLLQASMGYLAFLDSKKESLTLKKSFSYRLGKDRKFRYCNKTYLIKEICLDVEGQMICDFTEECNKIDLQIKEEKLHYRKRMQTLQELAEEKLMLEAKDQERLEAYRRAKEQEAKQECNSMDKPKEMNAPKLTQQQLIQMDLNPTIYEKCKKMIEEGNAHLVSKKYYDAIMSNLYKNS
jgi:competence protein CoiA